MGRRHGIYERLFTAIKELFSHRDLAQIILQAVLKSLPVEILGIIHSLLMIMLVGRNNHLPERKTRTVWIVVLASRCVHKKLLLVPIWDCQRRDLI